MRHTLKEVKVFFNQSYSFIYFRLITISLTYIADEKNISDVAEELSSISSDISTVESESSSDNYAIGDYLTFNGKFCRVTSPIEVDDDIVIGVNVVQTTIGTELKTALS